MSDDVYPAKPIGRRAMILVVGIPLALVLVVASALAGSSDLATPRVATTSIAPPPADAIAPPIGTEMPARTRVASPSGTVIPAPTRRPKTATELHEIGGRPFEYEVPTSMDLDVMQPSGAVLAFRHRTKGPDVAATGDAVYGLLDDNKRPMPGTYGIAVFLLGDGPTTHVCEGNDKGGWRESIRVTPAEFIEDVRTIGSIGLGAVVDITFDGRPAVTADVAPELNRCWFADAHLDHMASSQAIRLGMTCRLIVTRFTTTTKVIQIWAGSQDDFEAWLPDAETVVATFHFPDQP